MIDHYLCYKCVTDYYEPVTNESPKPKTGYSPLAKHQNDAKTDKNWQESGSNHRKKS